MKASDCQQCAGKALRSIGATSDGVERGRVLYMHDEG